MSHPIMKRFISIIVSLLLIITMVDTATLSAIAEDLSYENDFEQFEEESELLDSDISESEDTVDDELLEDEENDFLTEDYEEEVEEEYEDSSDDVEESDEIEVAQENSEETTEEEISETAPFEQESIIDDIIVSVRADEGVFPLDSALSVQKIDKEVEENVNEAVETERGDDRNVAASYTFDIKVLSSTGDGIEPDTSKGKVYVSFKMSEVSDNNLQTDI